MVMSGLLSSACFNPAFASSIIFQGQNAALFSGANPSDTTALMSSVVKPNNPNAASASALSTQSLILQSVESQISTHINNIIFNNANAAGSFNLGNGSLISFVRAAGLLTINLTDPVHGLTTITIPDV